MQVAGATTGGLEFDSEDGLGGDGFAGCRGIGQHKVVGEGGEGLCSFRAEAGEACGEGGLGSDGDLGATGGDGAKDAVGGVGGAGGDEWCDGAEGEPAELLIWLAGEAGLNEGAGAEEAGIHGGDADAFLAEFGVQALREADEGELACAVGEQMGNGNLASDAGDVDDAAGGLLAECVALEHVRENGLDGVQRSVEMGFDGALEGVEGLVLEGGYLNDAGVVDEDIELAEGRDCVLDGGDGLCAVGDVGGDEQDAGGVMDGAALEQKLAGAGELVQVAGYEGDAAAGAGETLGEAKAEAAGAAGDQNGFTLEGGQTPAPRADYQRGEGGSGPGGERGGEDSGFGGAAQGFHARLDGYGLGAGWMDFGVRRGSASINLDTTVYVQ